MKTGMCKICSAEGLRLGSTCKRFEIIPDKSDEN
jgi:hypothetical protein